MKIHRPKNMYEMQKILSRLAKNKIEPEIEGVILTTMVVHDMIQKIIILENRISELEKDND